MNLLNELITFLFSLVSVIKTVRFITVVNAFRLVPFASQVFFPCSSGDRPRRRDWTAWTRVRCGPWCWCGGKRSWLASPLALSGSVTTGRPGSAGSERARYWRVPRNQSASLSEPVCNLRKLRRPSLHGSRRGRPRLSKMLSTFQGYRNAHKNMPAKW